MTREALIAELAKVGMDIMMVKKWDDLPENSIDKYIWRMVADAMLKRLYGLYLDDALDAILKKIDKLDGKG